jgi:hypothetical protein
MTPGKYRARRPYFAPKPARTTALDADARRLHTAAEHFTLASPDDSGALFEAIFLAEALGPITAAYRLMEHEGGTYDHDYVLGHVLRGVSGATRVVEGQRLGDIAAEWQEEHQRRVAEGIPVDNTTLGHVLGMLEALAEATLREGMRETIAAEARRAVEAFELDMATTVMLAEARRTAASLELDLVTTVMQGLGVNERGATPPAGSLMMVRPVSHHHGGRGCFATNPDVTASGWTPEGEPAATSIGNFVTTIKLKGRK